MILVVVFLAVGMIAWVWPIRTANCISKIQPPRWVINLALRWKVETPPLTQEQELRQTKRNLRLWGSVPLLLGVVGLGFEIASWLR